MINVFLSERIDDGDFPSACYLVADKDEVVLSGALGHSVVDPENIEATFDTIYDMASVTKVLVTGLLTAQLIERGDLSVDSKVFDLLPDFQADDKRHITVEHLLTHTSYLSAWKPLYLCVADPSEIVVEIARTPLIVSDTGVTYSDLNFILLGKIIERITGLGLDRATDQYIIQPLCLRDTSFNPSVQRKRRIAASETGNVYERQTCTDMGYIAADSTNSAFRTDVIWGEVHDANAYFMGGVAGHAGLFSTAVDTLRIAQQFLPNLTTLLKPETCGLFRSNYTPNAEEHRSFSFQLASTSGSTAGSKMSPQSYGHLGFTGTSLWIDPDKERVFILLTNRTHDHKIPFVNINSVRRRFHDLANEILGEK